MTMPAFRLDDKRQVFASQLPLHEGHCNRIERSSRVDLFARAEAHSMRCWGDGDGISPRHSPLGISKQERLVSFQFIENIRHTRFGKPQFLRDALGG